MMNGRRKSDSCVVPTKSVNKLMLWVSAERMEGRRLVKGTVCSQTSLVLMQERAARSGLSAGSDLPVALTCIRLVFILVVMTRDKSRMR